MADVFVRPYRSEDRRAVRDIAWETAFMGEPAGIFFEDKEVLLDFLTLYFTDHEPGSCFVAERESRVVGYLLGTTDERRLKQVFASDIFWRSLAKAATRGSFLKTKNLTFLFRCLVSFLRGEFKRPDIAQDYPATLHINLKRPFRQAGTGTGLMDAYLGFLKEKGVRGVHLATMSQEAGRFFEKQGFRLFGQSKRSYFRHILDKNISVYIYVRKLL